MGGLALVVDRRGASLEEGNHGTVVVRHADGTRERVGIKALSTVVLNGDVMVSTHLLRVLAQEGVGVVLLPVRGLAQSVGFTRLPHGMTTLRHAQHLVYANAEQRLAMARLVVTAKAGAQLQLQARWGFDVDQQQAQMGASLAQANSIAALMGVEGALARAHFARLATKLDPAWAFGGRERRPPGDPFNALLSLGYTLALEATAQLALRWGLDLEVGFLHSIQPSRPSLTLDLMEPVRAVVEAWTLELIACGTKPTELGDTTFGSQSAQSPSVYAPKAVITLESFSDNLADGWRLNKAARALYYQHWFATGQVQVLHHARPLLARVLQQLRLYRHSVGCTAETTT